MPTVPIAQLSGVIPVAPTTQGFVLPVFLAPQYSNAYLVQVLGSTREVESFSDLVSEEPIVRTSVEETSSPGGEAIWAFQISQGSFVISGASQFRAELFDQLERRNITLSPYVQWEVERLFGANDKRRAAVRKLHAEMTKWNSDWADYWLSNLFVLPTIRQEVERVALPSSNEEITASIKSLRVECTRKGVSLQANETFLDWIAANKPIFRAAMETAANEWRGTSVGTSWSLANSTKTQDSPILKRSSLRKSHLPEKRLTPPSFKSAQILFDKSWSSYERTLGMNLVDAIARKLLARSFESSIEKIVTKSPPRTIAAYAARNTSLSKLKEPRIATKPGRSEPPLTIICGGDYRFVLGMFRRTPKSVQLRASDTNILLFRSREEAEETFIKLENLTSQTQRISQVWIAEPDTPNKQLELRYFSTAAFRDPRSIGYLSPPRTASSMAKYLPELRTKDFFLVLADNHTVSEANIIARSLMTTKPDPGGNIVEVVICFVGGLHGNKSGKSPLVPGVHTAVVDIPPTQLLQRARAIFSALGPSSAGMFASTRAPLVFVATDGRHTGSTSYAASMMGAVATEIYPAFPLEKQNHTNIRRALRRASEELRHERVARRRQVACRGLYRAVELLEDFREQTSL